VMVPLQCNTLLMTAVSVLIHDGLQLQEDQIVSPRPIDQLVVHSSSSCQLNIDRGKPCDNYRVTKQLSFLITSLYSSLHIHHDATITETHRRTRMAALRTLCHGFKKSTLRSYACIYGVLPLPAASSSIHSTLARCYMYPTAAVSTA